MGNAHCRTWNMAKKNKKNKKKQTNRKKKTLKNVENEKCILQDLKICEKTKKTVGNDIHTR